MCCARAVQSISDLIRDTGFINLDFADVTAIMKNAGMAHMGVGRAAGKGKAEEAAKMAISSPLLETSIEGAKGVLINVTGSMDIGLEEVEQAASLVQAAVHPDALTIFGATFDETLDDEIRVTVIATGFDKAPEQLPKVPPIQAGDAGQQSAAQEPHAPEGRGCAQAGGAGGRPLRGHFQNFQQAGLNGFFQDLQVFACGSCFFAAAAAKSKPAMGLLPHFARRVFPPAADDNVAGRSSDLPAAFRKGVISCMDHFKKQDTRCGAERRWFWHCCCARPCRRMPPA